MVDHAINMQAEDQGEQFEVEPTGFTNLTSWGTTSYAPAARVSRQEAVQVAAVKRSRDLIAGSLGTLPVVTVKPDLTTDSTSWLMQPEKDVPRSVTMTRLIEDLLYEGVAWWRITAFDWRGFPAQVVRLDPRTVTVLDDQRVEVTSTGNRGVSKVYPPDSELIRFESPNDALLVAGARAIRQCLALDTAAHRYSDGAPPTAYMTAEGDVDPFEDDTEAQEFVDRVQESVRRSAIPYMPSGIKLNVPGWSPEQLQLADARQHAVLEIARIAGIDPEELGVSTTSRTYSNQQDRRKAFLDFTLGGYRAAVEDRLSMGDVTPRGTLVRFDLGDFLRSDDKTRFETYEIGLRIGAITPEQIAVREKNPTVNQPQPRALPAPQREEAPVAAESTLRAVNFDADDVVTFDAPVAPEVFSVDVEKRVIKGLAVPYGVVSNDGRTFQFSKGSITFADPSRIKLLVGHNWDRAVGKATALEDTDAGLMATFSVARGAQGDEALSMAEDGVWDGLSVGVGKGMKTRLVDGVQHVLSAPLREISQTPCPAYDGARITEVAASAHQGRNTMKCTKCGIVHADGVTECNAADVTAFEADNAGQDFSALTEALSDGIKSAFTDLRNPQERETVSAAGGGTVEVNEPSPYRFDGNPGEHSLVEDLRTALFSNDSEARQRLTEFGETFAVTSGNVGTLNPTQNRPDLYVPNLTFTRPLWESVSTGVVTDKTPFTVPKFSSATGLVANHTEGTEPTPGAFTATNQTITPAPMSGKIEINREVLDQGGSPKADAIIWGEMLNAYYEAIEAKIAAALAAIGTAELNLAGAVDAPLVNAMTNYFAGLQFVRGGNRYTGLVLDGNLFPALINAADSTGRKLLPVLGPQNAQGTVGGAFDRVAIGNQQGRAAWALGTGNDKKSYSFVPSSVWAWASAPSRFQFEYQVKSIDLAIWGYAATAITRDSDVKPIDYTTAD